MTNPASLDIKNWHDLPTETLRAKKLIGGLCVALAIIIAIGSGVGSYFCLASPNPLDAAFSAFPLTLGPVLVLVLLMVAGIAHTEVQKVRDDRPIDQVRQDFKQCKTLKDAHARYQKKICPLVTREILTPEQGRELRTLIENYTYKIQRSALEERWKVLYQDVFK